MPIVHIPSALRQLAGGIELVEVPGESLRAVIDSLEHQCPGIARHLTEGDGLARGLAVSIDGQISSRGLWARVKPDSEVHFVPAIGGG